MRIMLMKVNPFNFTFLKSVGNWVLGYIKVSVCISTRNHCKEALKFSHKSNQNFKKSKTSKILETMELK